MLTATTLDAYNLLHQGALALARAERQGVCCDVEYCQKMSNHLDRKMERLKNQVMKSDLVTRWKKKYGKKFTLNSGDQLADILFNELKLEPLKTTEKGAPSTDEESLDALDLPELRELLRIRKLKKGQDYLKGFAAEAVDGVIHTNFNLNLARSFRPSTDSPNLANVPKRNAETQKLVRSAIIPRPGHKILSADFKGVEVGISCVYHHDPVLISYVEDKTKDMHRDMAMKLYMIEKELVTKPIRHSGKNEFVFPSFYGSYYRQTAEDLWLSAQTHIMANGQTLLSHLKSKGITKYAQFEKHVESVENWFWKENFSKYDAWKLDWWESYCRKGYIDYLTGFRCYAIMDRKQACNYPVQGTAFHCLLQCIIWLDEIILKENWKSRIVNQIYDDLLVDIHPDEEEKVISTMNYLMSERIKEHWNWINVPMGVEFAITSIDGSWYELKEIK